MVSVNLEKTVRSAPPPWHSVAFMLSMTIFFALQLPGVMKSIDQVATVETFSSSPFFDAKTLGFIRLLFALSIWMTTLEMVTSKGWTQIINWKKESKLKRNVPIIIKGYKTLLPFTSWSWNLLGVSYSINAAIALSVAYGGDVVADDSVTLKVALFIWEIVAPCAILVSVVIRYAIWEQVLKGTGDTTALRSNRNMMMHNMNSVFVLVEVGLLGGLPVRLSEIALAPLFGAAYVYCTWSWTHIWAPPEHGPQFIYYFFDTTMGKVTTISLAALLTALLSFHFFFAVADWCLKNYLAGSHVLIHCLFVVVASSLVCRTRD